VTEHPSTLLWVFPDVGTAAQHARQHARYWRPYAAAAADEGFTLRKVSPEQVVMAWGDHGCSVRLAEDDGTTWLDRHNTVVLGDIHTEPHRLQALWPVLSTLMSLRAAGYFLGTPLEWMLPGADKFATILSFAGLGMDVLPTLRVVSGSVDDELERQATELGLPLLLKPASWSGGTGLCVAESPAALRHLLRLAAGYGQPFVVQPYLREMLVDGRAYCVHGEVRLFVERRPQRPGDPGNVSLGGCAVPTDTPEPVVATARAVWDLTKLPYVCLDVLHDGHRWWLSEVEVDGAISVTGGVSAELARRLLRERFRAYRHAFARFLMDGRPSPVTALQR
jgi:glutathione synthase/RimK-type ligase-like ATP-grasp enzyme